MGNYFDLFRLSFRIFVYRNSNNCIYLLHNKIKQEIYKINQASEKITAHYELINGFVINAEFYTYSNYLLTKTEHADKSCLNR